MPGLLKPDSKVAAAAKDEKGAPLNKKEDASKKDEKSEVKVAAAAKEKEKKKPVHKQTETWELATDAVRH